MKYKYFGGDKWSEGIMIVTFDSKYASGIAADSGFTLTAELGFLCVRKHLGVYL